MQTGDRVIAKEMASDSFYKQVIGKVTGVRNGFVMIEADLVMSKWDDKFEAHPSFCSTAAKLEHVSVL